MVGRMLTLENNDSTIGDPWLTNYTEQYIIGKKRSPCIRTHQGSEQK